MAVEIVDVKEEHIEFVTEFMRPADQLEARRSTGMPGGLALRESIGISDFAATMLIDGNPASIFGVQIMRYSILGPVIASPWSVSTLVVDDNPKEFYRGSVVGLELLKDRADILVNYVDAEYTKAIRWLKRLGFSIHPPLPWGATGDLFHPFVWRRENV